MGELQASHVSDVPCVMCDTRDIPVDFRKFRYFPVLVVKPCVPWETLQNAYCA
jgi:hypothetical protein